MQIDVILTSMYNLNRKFLSPQRHYDWGLRELKAVLHGCGRFLNENNEENVKNSLNQNEETEIVIRAITANCKSRLTSSDEKR